MLLQATAAALIVARDKDPGSDAHPDATRDLQCDDGFYEVRDTPSKPASSRSGGRRDPAENSPPSISATICPAICRYSRVVSTARNGT